LTQLLAETELGLPRERLVRKNQNRMLIHLLVKPAYLIVTQDNRQIQAIYPGSKPIGQGRDANSRHG